MQRKTLSKNSVKTMIFTISPWCNIQRNQTSSLSKMSFHDALHLHVMVLLMLLNCETTLSCEKKEDNSNYSASCFIFISICVLFTNHLFSYSFSKPNLYQVIVLIMLEKLFWLSFWCFQNICQKCFKNRSQKKCC